MNTNLDNAAPAATTKGGPTSQLQWLVSIEGAAGTAIEYIANAPGWELSDRDIGREVFIAAERYEIVAVDSPEKASGFMLDRPYEGDDNPAAVYGTGSVAVGAPWTVRIPTRLIILSSSVSRLSTVSP